MVMITREKLEQKVIEIVQDTLALPVAPKLEDAFRKDLNADSIDIITLLVSLEDELGTPFDQNALEGKDTIISVVDFLEEVLQQAEI
jgi:acyl carrier protein